MSIVPDVEAPPNSTAEPAHEPRPDPIAEAMARIMNRTPEQVMADRERILAKSPPPHPIPPGKTWIDMVVGQWPGDETDEEIEEWLRNRKRTN
jgi:hypothetical protein